VAVIPSTSLRKVAIPHGAKRYRLRNVVERTFHRIKDFRGIDIRYDKTARNLLAAVCLVSGITYWVRRSLHPRVGAGPHEANSYIILGSAFGIRPGSAREGVDETIHRRTTPAGGGAADHQCGSLWRFLPSWRSLGRRGA
jgi:hypothetical protein